ncbi:MAG: extracellular solute-binding protein [Sulfuricaulis sp.]|nr:extracellular solute-binding protein [Sulfuricaulis sp.]
MAKLAEKLMVALVLALFMQVVPAAEDPPAVKAAAGPQKEPLRALIAAAAKEGELSSWDAVIQPATHNVLYEAFLKQYGLPASFKVNYSLSVTTNLVTRVDQELSAGRVTMDTIAIASLPWVHAKVNGGHVMRYDSPQYAAYKQVFEKGLGKEGYFAFNGAYLFVPMWDAGKLNFKGTSWQDVIGAVPSGRMSVGDAGLSLTYLATYMGLKPVLGIDYFRKLAAMKPTFVVRSESIANQVVTGQDSFAYSGMPTRAYQFNKRGAKLKFMLPKEGVVLLPQAMFILAKAPHPSAAKLWLDFILSEAGQKILVENEALISGRTGFVSPIPDYAPPIDKLNVIKIDWDKITAEDQSKAKAEWLSIFKP